MHDNERLQPPFDEDALWEEISAYHNDDGSVNSKYPFNNNTQTESGHLFEMDDTPDHERIRILHGPSKTFVEIHPDGTVVTKINKHSKVVISNNSFVHVKGISNIRVEGNCNLVVNGDFNHRVAGDYNLDIGGTYNMLTRGKIDVTSGKKIYMEACDALGVQGQVEIMAGESVKVSSELDVELGIRGESVISRSFMTAGTGIHAGVPIYNPLGAFTGISTLGSVAAGSSAAPPVPGMVVATLMVTAPLILGVIVSDIRGPMELIRILYDVHIHPHPFGPTALPIPPM